MSVNDPWLLIRGLSRQQQHWGEFPRYLQHYSGRDVLFEDLPGFGERNAQASPATIEGIGDCIASVLAMQSGKVNLIGISMGGMVALDLARDYPDKVNSLVLINSSFKPFAHFYQRLRPGAYAGLIKALCHPDIKASEQQILRLTSNVFQEDEVVLEKWRALRAEKPPRRQAVIQQLLAASRYHYGARKPPENLLLIASEQDRVVNPVCSENIASSWRAPLIAHTTAGHDLPLDDPEWLALTICEWHQKLD